MPSTVSSAATVSVRAPDAPKTTTPLRLTSQSFDDGADVPMPYVFQGCGGKNTAPQLSWTGAPDGTKSYAITCFDPDAPTGSGFWHWLAFDIPASVTSLDEGAGNDDSPKGGKTATNDYGMTGYGGPCPPKGDGKHRYIFTVYALDVDAIEGASGKLHGATLVFMMRGHVLAQGSLTARFGH